MFTLYQIVFRSNVKKTPIRTFLESYMSRVLNTVVELLRLLHMMNVRFSLLNMAQRILGVTLPNF